MQLSFNPPSPLEYFATLVQSDDNFPLLEAAVSIGHIQAPVMDVQGVLSQVDAWLVRLRRRVASDAAPLARLLALNQFFYKDLGFGGNLNDYYATGNSYIHALLESRRGIPISMAVLWLELAQGIGLTASGVSFPGHFLIKISLPMGQAVIDPLSGQSFSGEKLSEMLEPYRLSPDFEVPMGLYLQAAPAREILARMLRNLKEIFKSQKQWAHWLEVQERLVVLMPEAWTEYRDRGLAHAALGNHSLALADLEHYLAHVQDVVDVDAIAQQVEMLRTALGRRTEPN
ncbi:MAG: tetratricopeptide repeat protein [Sulfuritalea sp.]|jgi:regulator of sirC expression with transglutaminase-like and TPR domain|nr:tetratricopeptide repeat protein [Sulfuritalea sp.]